MLTLQSNKKKRFNPWAIGVWAAEHPYWSILLLMLTIGTVFFALSSLWEPFILVTFIGWGTASLMLFFGVIWVIMDFTYENRIDDVKRWVRRKAREFEQVED